MHELSKLFQKMLVKTKFWQEHYLILQLFQPLRLTAAIAVLFTLLGAVLEATGIGLVAVLLQGLTNANQPPLQSGIGWFDVWFLGTQASASERIYRISGLILVNVWLRGGFSYVGRYYAKFCEVNLIDSLRKKIFEQFQSLSLSYYTEKRSGELFQTFSTEVSEISYAFNEVINFVSKSCIILAYTLAMFMISWQLTLATVLLFSLLAAGAANLIKRVRAASVEMTAAGSELASTAVEFVSGVRTVQAFWTQDFERRRFDRVAGKVTKAWMKTTSISAMVQPLVEALATTILIAMILVAVTTLVATGKLHVVLLLAFLFALFRLLPIIAHMNSSWGIIATYYGSLRSVNELLRTDNKTYQEDGELEFAGLKQAIAFNGVDFSYDDRKLVLEDITLTIKRNQMLALVGASGSGKTTLADLLMRFYDPTRGKILIDGIDLRQFRLQSLRSRMAVVSQDTFIFNTTVKNNIAYGLEAVDEAEIEEVARQANALEFILDLPQGFQTKLGDRGVRLSGGQRQRIAIARALLRNPEILILDEATSSLDSVSERLIQDSLEKLAVGRTVIAIAHRLSTIFRADKIVVLEQGHIIEQGGYQELLQQRGKFWQYHQMQYELGVRD
ncbi:ABC transporter-related protein [Tolypothrix tenuis PCC 7101]|uniref:ABC transporter-related protein n=1 Tax=Tolypothrix tenuis PCC 7101 TaxID=231146 RepID=A0A1Z4NAB9_9CYAN|nr:ABC transporter ATP-binding protein [Aulosira sp. FACHB-113]BAZ02615.1 ABC transporter-related protein [Tolypothrix tenuis PCC 7101]BAZ73464.1 ABC transporter-related protein [Aulosira laxa NIES-50]